MKQQVQRQALGYKLQVPRGRPFSMIQNDALMRLGCTRALTGADKSVLAVLVAGMDRGNYTYGTADGLAELTEYKIAATSAALRKLVKGGWLEKTKRQSVYRVPTWVATPADIAQRMAMPDEYRPVAS